MFVNLVKLSLIIFASAVLVSPAIGQVMIEEADDREACVKAILDHAVSVNPANPRRELTSLFSDAGQGYIRSEAPSGSKKLSRIAQLDECSFSVAEQLYASKRQNSGKTDKEKYQANRGAQHRFQVAVRQLSKYFESRDNTVSGDPYVATLRDISRILERDSVLGQSAKYADYGSNYGISTFRIQLTDGMTLPADRRRATAPFNRATPQFDFDGAASIDPQACIAEGADGACRKHLEFLLTLRVFRDYWEWVSSIGLSRISKRFTSAQNEYENYFFESSGDGLYPWEIWVNSLGKSDVFLDVPTVKWNVFHPSPYVAYGNEAGELEPAAMVEIVGVTFLNYSHKTSVPSAPIGGAFAVDLSNDDVRFGGVVHLPLKRAVYELGEVGESLSEFVPCQSCSFVFLTDGDDDWSVGVKLDVARLFYRADDAKRLFRNFSQ